MSWQRFSLGTFIILLPAILIWLTWLLTAPLGKPHPSVRGVNYQATDILLTQFRTDGKPRYRIRAAHLTHTLPDDITHLIDVHLTLFRTRGAPLLMTTPLALILADHQHILLPQRAVIFRHLKTGQLRLVTTNVMIDTRTRIVQTPRLATLTGPGFQTSGRGLRLDLNRQTIKFEHHVTSLYKE